MRILLLFGGLGLVALAGCVTPTDEPTTAQPVASAAPQAATATAAPASLQERLSGSRLDLQGQGGDTPSMVMVLNEDGSSTTSMSGLTLTARWQVEGDRLCQTEIRFMGMPSDDPAPQCVRVSVSGDRITMTGPAEDGGSETFAGTITPL